MSRRSFKVNKAVIEDARIQRGWTLAELAGKAIVSTRTLDSVMGGAPASLKTLGKIAKALGLRMSSILDGHEEKGDTAPKQAAASVFEVSVTLSIPSKLFNQAEFYTALKAVIESVEDFKVKGYRDGSTIVTLEMTQRQWELLMKAYLAGKLKPLNVVNITRDDIDINDAVAIAQRYMTDFYEANPEAFQEFMRRHGTESFFPATRGEIVEGGLPETAPATGRKKRKKRG